MGPKKNKNKNQPRYFKDTNSYGRSPFPRNSGTSEVMKKPKPPVSTPEGFLSMPVSIPLSTPLPGPSSVPNPGVTSVSTSSRKGESQTLSGSRNQTAGNLDTAPSGMSKSTGQPSELIDLTRGEDSPIFARVPIRTNRYPRIHKPC